MSEPQLQFPEYFLPNMQELAERTAIHFTTTREHPSISSEKPEEQQIIHHHLDEKAKKILPFSVSLKQIGIDNKEKAGIAQISAQEAHPHFLKIILEEIYGKELAETGIYEATDLNLDHVITLDPLARYFPEIKEITSLNKRHILIYNNPFLTLLTLPVETRAFFTGALLESLEELLIKEDSKAEVFSRPLTLPSIMTYATKVGEIAKVREYMDIYNQSK